MSNVVDKLTNQPLGEGLVKHIITWEGRKVKNCILVTFSYLCYCIAQDFVGGKALVNLCVCVCVCVYMI